MIRHISKRALLAMSLALPLVVFSASWVMTWRQAQQGELWLAPITGYDPRDLLRGHYVQYRYDWPTGRADDTSLNHADALCIHGHAPHITYVSVYTGPQDRCAAIVRATSGTRREVQGLDRGILYVSQPRAITLSKQLADPGRQGFVQVKIRPDGVMRPVDMMFSPR